MCLKQYTEKGMCGYNYVKWISWDFGRIGLFHKGSTVVPITSFAWKLESDSEFVVRILYTKEQEWIIFPAYFVVTCLAANAGDNLPTANGINEHWDVCGNLSRSARSHCVCLSTALSLALCWLLHACLTTYQTLAVLTFNIRRRKRWISPDKFNPGCLACLPFGFTIMWHSGLSQTLYSRLPLYYCRVYCCTLRISLCLGAFKTIQLKHHIMSRTVRRSTYSCLSQKITTRRLGIQKNQIH